ncbi:MAG: N-6 DNA methylase [Bacteroidales bacterium]|nr:N-6 DNA methylase [Bacteroidales bacterium]MBQ9311778.1 N-6 DNA methylase [Bacteroidales bacterium]
MPSKQKVKHHGQVYTPYYLVEIILDFGGYNNKQILRKHIIDNSCGNGAFLCEIVRRYCYEYLKYSSDILTLKDDLQLYIHGIEIQKQEYEQCISNLNNIVKQFNIENVIWDIKNADTLTISEYNLKMDYVFGNPPYVRVHNLDGNYKLVKQYQFAQQGMTDLFIVFFEIGFKMLSKFGKMCLITPSSWLNSNAGQKLRQYIYDKKNMSGVIDLQHFQAFSATTYSLISRFDNNQIHEEFDYYTFNSYKKEIYFQEKLSIGSIKFDKQFYISKYSDLQLLEKIRTNKIIKKYVQVKNGFATLNDKIFIGDFDFTDGTIDVLKASTGVWSRIIFPYDNRGKALPLDKFKNNKKAYEYMILHKKALSKNKDVTDDKYWYLYGRTQAIKDVFNKKYAINTIIKDMESIRLEEVAAGKGIYSGLYILTQENYDTIKQLIYSEEFINYIRLLKNYKSGGYYTYSSKDLEMFLNYKLAEQYGQSKIFTSNKSLF